MIASAAENPKEAKRGASLDIHVTYTSTTKEGDVLIIDGKADRVGKTMAFISVEIRALKESELDEEKDKLKNSLEGIGRLVAKGSHTKYLA